MGDFDYMYERGLVDASGMPTWNDYDTTPNYTSTTTVNNNLIKESIVVYLTPDKYLDNAQQYKRSKLLNDCLDTYKLELFHDSYNENDHFALKVYCDEIMIGYIQKYDNINDINQFAFKDNKLINDVNIEYKDNTLTLFRYLEKKDTLTDEQIKKYVNSGLTKCGFYDEFKTAYISYGTIIPVIKEHIDKLKYELRASDDYKQYIETNYHLYESIVKESTEEEELRKQKEEELRKQKEKRIRQKNEELRKQKNEELRKQEDEELRKQVKKSIKTNEVEDDKYFIIGAVITLIIGILLPIEETLRVIVISIPILYLIFKLLDRIYLITDKSKLRFFKKLAEDDKNRF